MLPEQAYRRVIICVVITAAHSGNCTAALPEPGVASVGSGPILAVPHLVWWLSTSVLPALGLGSSAMK